MFLKVGDGILDFDLQFLRQLVGLLDSQLESIEKEPTYGADPDLFGDDYEYIAGIGFVACQGYLAATAGGLGIRKPDALQKGPEHRSGYTIAELVNHAANFWKHHEEWPTKPNSRQQSATLAALAALDVEGRDYPLSCALAALVLPTSGRFQALLSHLEAWRDALASAE